MLQSYEDLNDVHVDALSEIGNIGVGNAATAFGMMLGENINLSTPHVSIDDYHKVIDSIGGMEDIVAAVIVDYFGDISGSMVFAFPIKDAQGIIAMLMGQDPDNTTDFHEFGELQISAIKEIGNILASSYLGSIAQMTGLLIDISIPYVSIDMLGAVMASPLAEYAATQNKVLFIEGSISTGSRDYATHMIMFSDMESLQALIKRLGIEA
ncbi:MAG: chemotaxis protein CheC [Clostridiales Family XIII bacterium]|nr:chemotaxis protein CheC [Clostridiales Family XIII bacterium]